MPNVPISGSGYTFTVSLFSQATGEILDNPTLDAADFSISTDGGGYSSLSSAPTVTPASSGIVEINLTASEVGTSHFTVKISDDAGAEWKTMLYHESVGIDSGTGGSGSISHVITVCDTSSNPIDGVAVWITTDSAGTNIVAGTSHTDAMGNVTFMLDAGSYYGWQQLSGYNFTNPTQFTVS